VICEAMVTGRAVVATAVGGTPELVEPGVTGQLVDPGDFAQLADALVDVLATPGRSAAMGAIAADRARDTLTWAAVAQQIESVYREVLAREHSVASTWDPADGTVPPIVAK